MLLYLLPIYLLVFVHPCLPFWLQAGIGVVLQNPVYLLQKVAEIAGHGG